MQITFFFSNWNTLFVRVKELHEASTLYNEYEYEYDYEQRLFWMWPQTIGWSLFRFFVFRFQNDFNDIAFNLHMVTHRRMLGEGKIFI